MPPVDQYRSRILKKYSIMVDYKGTPHRTNVPASIGNETFKQWKIRVLGADVSDVVVLAPWEPSQQTQMRTIQEWTNLQWPKKIAKELIAKKDQERERAVQMKDQEKDQEREQAVNEQSIKIAKTYSQFSRETLADLAFEMDGELQASVREFIEKKLHTNEPNLDTEELVRSLISAYNNAVRHIHQNMA